MIRSLRKGRISVYVQHEHVGNTIGAEKFEAEVKDGFAVLRMSLRPVDGNQRNDESYLHDHPIKSLDVDDSVVIHGFESHAKGHRTEFSKWGLEIISQGKLFKFTVKPSYQQYGAREVLTLVVANEGDA